MSQPYENVGDLKQLLEANVVEPSDRSFASDLCAKATKYGKLSPKQLEWVDKLITRALVGRPEPETTELGNSLAPMVAMLTFAKQHLKYPKVRLETESGKKVVLALAGQKAQHPGSVNVTDGGPYMDNVWYGRVYNDGKFEHGGKMAGTDAIKEVDALLAGFAADPTQAAAAYGKLSGSCCFCGQKLTTKESTSVGYGPVCAEHFGLEWGGKA